MFCFIGISFHVFPLRPVFSQGKYNTMSETGILAKNSQTAGQSREKKESGFVWYPSSCVHCWLCMKFHYW